jgi:hypothetical protein
LLRPFFNACYSDPFSSGFRAFLTAPSDRQFTDNTYYVQTVGDCQTVVTQLRTFSIHIPNFNSILEAHKEYSRINI